MELFLYRCERCGVASFAVSDHGPTWYVDCCGSCKDWSDNRKVVIHCVEGRYVFDDGEMLAHKPEDNNEEGKVNFN
jgi:hypothetical protein